LVVAVKPSASSELVRRQMSRQRRRDTRPEVALRRELHARGMRFRVDARVGSAKPDILLTSARIAVFVMGDFWHMCPEHGTTPKANREWWLEKFAGNRARDERQRNELTADGWRVEWVWECESPAVAADRLEATWRERTARPLPAVVSSVPP
jgi:DNA mismatch endonuclease (patch repair protein)